LWEHQTPSPGIKSVKEKKVSEGGGQWRGKKVRAPLGRFLPDAMGKRDQVGLFGKEAEWVSKADSFSIDNIGK